MILLTSLLGVLVAASAVQNDATRTVIIVNGEEIKASEYYHRMEHLPATFTPVNNQMIEVPPGLLTIDRLITEHLMLQLAAEHGVAPKESEVDAAFQAQLKANPMLMTDATNQGMTEADVKQKIRVDIARFKLATEGVIITDQEVQDEYKNNPDRYTTPKTVTLRVIVVSTDDQKAAVDSDLASGKKFEDVARARSLDISKIQGGSIGTIPLNSLDEGIQTALAAAKIGGTTGWVTVPKQTNGTNLVEKILFEGAEPAKLMPLDDNLKESIRNQMKLLKGSVKNDVQKEMAAMMQKSSIDIKDRAFAKAWTELKAQAAGSKS